MLLTLMLVHLPWALALKEMKLELFVASSTSSRRTHAPLPLTEHSDDTVRLSALYCSWAGPYAT